MGTGLLVINSDEHLNSLIEGGTGSFSAVLSQPEIYPDRFESGTLNVPGILSLGEGIRFVSDRGVSRIYKSEQGHIADIYKALKIFRTFACIRIRFLPKRVMSLFCHLMWTVFTANRRLHFLQMTILPSEQVSIAHRRLTKRTELFAKVQSE